LVINQTLVIINQSVAQAPQLSILSAEVFYVECENGEPVAQESPVGFSES